VSSGANATLASLQPLFAEPDADMPESPRREAFIAALNGVMGDRLQAEDSPFATTMSLRHGDAILDDAGLDKLPSTSGKNMGRILLMIHGLCMNDLQWRREVDGQFVDHGKTLADQRGYMPVYVRYNTGLSIAQNASRLAQALENLLALWPAEVEDLTIVAHSMGGLLIRHAVHQAGLAEMRWPDRLNSVVFLGTPHHGAPLERTSAWVQSILGATPYSAPFVKLSGLRSAGITDLGHGCSAQDLPLAPGVNWYAVAATTASKRGIWTDHLTGDGLVPLRSALGEARQGNDSLPFANRNTHVVYGTNHMALLHSKQVSEQLLRWLA
jgi:pimeloyl-ACP methyl ester carboxylesterase